MLDHQMTVVTTYNSVEEQAVIGEAASAVSLHNNQTVEPEMKMYCLLCHGCRRNYLFGNFDNYIQPVCHSTCSCCNLCKSI